MTDSSDTEIGAVSRYRNCIVYNHDSDTLSESFSPQPNKSPSRALFQETESDQADRSDSSIHLDPELLADATLSSQELYQFIVGMLAKTQKYLDSFNEDEHINTLKSYVLLIKIALIKHHKLYGVDKVKEVDGILYFTKSNSKRAKKKNNLKKKSKTNETLQEKFYQSNDVPSTSRRLSVSPKSPRTKKKDNRGVNLSPRTRDKINKKVLSWKRKNESLAGPSTTEQSGIVNSAVFNAANTDIDFTTVDMQATNAKTQRRKSVPLKITNSPRSVERKKFLEFQHRSSKSPEKKSGGKAQTSGKKQPKKKESKSSPKLNTTRRSSRLEAFKRERQVCYCDQVSAVALRLGLQLQGKLTSGDTVSKTKKSATKTPVNRSKSSGAKVKESSTIKETSTNKPSSSIAQSNKSVKKMTKPKIIQKVSEAKSKLPTYKTKLTRSENDPKTSKAATKNVRDAKTKLPIYKTKLPAAKKDSKINKSPGRNASQAKINVSKKTVLSKKTEIAGKSSSSSPANKKLNKTTSKSVEKNQQTPKKRALTFKKTPRVVKNDEEPSGSFNMSLNTRSHNQAVEKTPNKRSRSDATIVIPTKRRATSPGQSQKRVKKTPLRRKDKPPVNKRTPKSNEKKTKADKPSTRASVSPKNRKKQSPKERRKTFGGATSNADFKKRGTVSLGGGLLKKAKPNNDTSFTRSPETFSEDTTLSSGTKRKLYSFNEWMSQLDIGLL